MYGCCLVLSYNPGTTSNRLKVCHHFAWNAFQDHQPSRMREHIDTGSFPVVRDRLECSLPMRTLQNLKRYPFQGIVEVSRLKNPQCGHGCWDCKPTCHPREYQWLDFDLCYRKNYDKCKCATTFLSVPVKIGCWNIWFTVYLIIQTAFAV